MTDKVGYSGISFPFRFGGGGGVSTSTTNENDFTHLKESIIQIVCTSLGERVFKPEFGSNLRSSLFDLGDVTSVALMKSYIEDSLSVLKDRIQVVSIVIDEDTEHEGTIIIEIEIYVKKYYKSESVSFSYEMGGM